MNKLQSLIMISMMVFSLSSCTSPATAQQENTVTVKEQMQKGAMLVDVRTPAEFAAGSAPGAVNIPLNEISGRISEFQDKPGVVVFCRSGKRSSEAIDILKKNRIENVTNGINAENVQAEMK